MSKADVMLAYVPQFLQAAKNYKAIIDAQGPEFESLDIAVQDVLKQFYVETATEPGLDIWENMLNLKSFSSKPLDQRRSRIISKLRGAGPVSITLFKSVASSYVYGEISVTKSPNVQKVIIKFIDIRGVPANLDDVKKAIEEIKPAHFEVEYQFTYTVYSDIAESGLIYDQIRIAGITYDQLKTWIPA